MQNRLLHELTSGLPLKAWFRPKAHLDSPFRSIKQSVIYKALVRNMLFTMAISFWEKYSETKLKFKLAEKWGLNETYTIWYERYWIFETKNYDSKLKMQLNNHSLFCRAESIARNLYVKWKLQLFTALHWLLAFFGFTAMTHECNLTSWLESLGCQTFLLAHKHTITQSTHPSWTWFNCLSMD